MRRAPLALIFVAACGSGGPPVGGGDNLPSAGAGPFRPVETSELAGAPYVLSGNPYSAPSAIDRDGDPTTPDVLLFVAEQGSSRTSIVWYDLPDGITAGTARTVALTQDPSSPWEGADVDQPAALRSGGDVLLYYASGGCIGRAVSADGARSFARRAAGPVLCADPTQGDGASVTAPSVHVGYDGAFHLLYESAGAIREATSVDGESFARVGTALAAAPAPALAPDAGVDGVFDSAAVGEPAVVLGQSASGRSITYLYYAGADRLGGSAIGLAARYGDGGAWARNPVPVLTRYTPRGPSVVAFAGYALLYATGASREVDPMSTPNILGAVTPTTAAVGGGAP